MNKLFSIFLLMVTGFWAQSQAPGNDALLQQGGHVRFDLDGNGCENTIVPASVRLLIEDGDVNQFNYSDPLTSAFAYLPGSYRVTPQPENPDYFSVTPAYANMIFGAGSNHNVDFCVSANGNRPDASVTIVPIDQPVLGHASGYRVVVRNSGNQTLDGTVNLNFPPDAVRYVSATPSPASRTPSTLHWNYTNLQPFQTQEFEITFDIGSSTTNPGDDLAFTANVLTTTADETPDDNVFDLRQFALTTFAANSKTCLEGTVAPPSMIGQYLNYVIYFENTTSSTVQKVVINDEIDITQYEISSLQILDLSHPGIPIVVNSKIEVYFQNIGLAPGGQGYVAFRIKTKPTVPVGATVSNKAKIYFDFNFPIETNTAFTTFQLLGLPENMLPEAKIFPNPTAENVTIEATQNMVSILVTDAHGRAIATFEPDAERVALDVSAYTSGIYYLKIVTANGTLTRKLIKQ